MIIRSKTIRLGIFISTLIISVIVLVQVFWLFKIYHYEEKVFDHHVFGVFKEMYDQTNLNTDRTLNLNDLVTKARPQVYFAKVQQWQSPDSIINIIDGAFEDFEIFTDSRISFYDQKNHQIFYEKELHPSANNNKKLLALPSDLTQPAYNSIIFYFPNRERYILSNMVFWIISSIVLLGVLLWLGASILYLYRQKTFNELQKDFVNNFTHEFKTPLSVIRLAAESLKKKSVLQNPGRIEHYADMVEYQSQYLQGQIDRLLRHSFAESSDLDLIKESLDIHDLIEEAVNNLQPLIDQKKASVILEKNAENPLIFGDKNYLLIVLVNLIENAIKYSAEPKVVVTTGNEKNMLCVSVKDNGVGIDEKYYDQIFKKFFRVPKGDIHSSKGFGIGLSFVKKIIDSHHGTITIKSVPGIGSNFTLSLHQNGQPHAKENLGIVSGR